MLSRKFTFSALLVSRFFFQSATQCLTSSALVIARCRSWRTGWQWLARATLTTASDKGRYQVEPSSGAHS